MERLGRTLWAEAWQESPQLARLDTQDRKAWQTALPDNRYQWINIGARRTDTLGRSAARIASTSEARHTRPKRDRQPYLITDISGSTLERLGRALWAEAWQESPQLARLDTQDRGVTDRLSSAKRRIDTHGRSVTYIPCGSRLATAFLNHIHHRQAFEYMLMCSNVCKPW